MKTDFAHQTPAKETAEEPLPSHALLEDFCFEFSARPVPVDNYYARNIFDAIPVKITAPNRDEAEKRAMSALGSPKERLACKWSLKLLSVRSSNSGHNAYNPALAFAEWPDKKGCLYLEKDEYELITTHHQTQQ